MSRGADRRLGQIRQLPEVVLEVTQGRHNDPRNQRCHISTDPKPDVI